MSGAPPPPLRQRLSTLSRRLLAPFAVRVALSVLIIVSLLPFEWVTSLEVLFLVVFAVEFALRVMSFLGPIDESEDGASAPGRRRLWSLSVLFLDLLALLSFVPWPRGDEGARWLRLFRLTRILLLFGYWGPVARDLWAVLSQKERARQVALLGLAVLILSFAGAVVLDQLATSGVDFNGDGKLDKADQPFFTRLWWAFRQIQDPGNMMANPSEILAVIISLALTIFGLFLVSFLIGLGSDVVREFMTLSRNRPPGMRNHTVIVHVTRSLPTLLGELLRYYRKLFSMPRYAVIGGDSERPDLLSRHEFNRIVYRHGVPGDPGYLSLVDASRAKRIVVLADMADPEPDMETTSTLLTAREANSSAWLIAEILEDSNASAARVAGGDRTVVVPTEKLLGLFIAAAAYAPHQEKLLQVFLTSHGHEIYTYFFEGAEGPLTIPEHGLSVDAIVEAGLARPGRERVVPIGLIAGGSSGHQRDAHQRELLLNTGDHCRRDQLHALIAVAENFHQMQGFARALAADGLPASDKAPMALARPVPELQPDCPSAREERVLLVGFRPATVTLATMLMCAGHARAIHLLLPDEEEREAAKAAFRERRLQIQAGLWREHAPAGYFEDGEGDALRYVYGPDSEPRGQLTMAVGDLSTDWALIEVPGTQEAVGAFDLVILVGAPDGQRDARTATTVLKLADFACAANIPLSEGFRIVAEVSDEDLASRLETSGRAAMKGPGRLRVLANRQLRAWFTFQSIVVPGFDAIYSMLLGAEGPTFRRLSPVSLAASAEDTWTFTELGRAIRRGMQHTLVAVELRGHPEPYICPPQGTPGDSFSWGEVAAIWVVGEGLVSLPHLELDALSDAQSA